MTLCVWFSAIIFFTDKVLLPKLQEAVDAAEQAEKATVFGYWVDDPERYGVVDFDKEGKVASVEEKASRS